MFASKYLQIDSDIINHRAFCLQTEGRNAHFKKKTILVTNKGARKALQIGYSHKGSISVHEWAVLKEAIAVTQTKPREIH